MKMKAQKEASDRGLRYSPLATKSSLLNSGPENTEMKDKKFESDDDSQNSLQEVCLQ